MTGMEEWTHYCIAHQGEHVHANWYCRESKEGETEFICGNELDGMPRAYKEKWERYPE
jgi:hypothetical protein